MTDPSRVPGAVAAAWSSGSTTLATGSAAFVTGPGWGPWDGALVMGGLKTKQLIFLRLAADGQSVTAQTFGLQNQYGRLRSVPRPPTVRCSSPRTTVPPTRFSGSPRGLTFTRQNHARVRQGRRILLRGWGHRP